MSSRYQILALQRYPVNEQLRKDYAFRLEQCKVQPAYHVQLPSGDLYPCHCEPLMEDDTKGWKVVKRRVRVKRAMTNQELDAEQNTDEWDDVEHYGRATYTNVHNYEYNGALFDIGARF